jgi:hypothetical protein
MEFLSNIFLGMVGYVGLALLLVFLFRAIPTIIEIIKMVAKMALQLGLLLLIGGLVIAVIRAL